MHADADKTYKCSVRKWLNFILSLETLYKYLNE
jgi:hypothetical protein